ncbi:lysophospholipase L1-like esterase [Actinoplanes tereljensis]|uniref:SGNH hydrolase-type esterase domain-containing protein n=1 Tax=Paractinoplanes tereljensis TaxID=571912 RepID=A0A919NYA8_9ACTN|nr:GDSL-type esterase/lipase family protein [Actinoplanes tereljensis]GIF25892.1 hypothetical protein Ate02nite_86220 [Actinoplanes tereljensis]
MGTENQSSGRVYGAPTPPIVPGRTTGAPKQRGEEGKVYGAAPKKPAEEGRVYGAPPKQPTDEGRVYGAPPKKPAEEGRVYGAPAPPAETQAPPVETPAPPVTPAQPAPPAKPAPPATPPAQAAPPAAPPAKPASPAKPAPPAEKGRTYGAPASPADTTVLPAPPVKPTPPAEKGRTYGAPTPPAPPASPDETTVLPAPQVKPTPPADKGRTYGAPTPPAAPTSPASPDETTVLPAPAIETAVSTLGPAKDLRRPLAIVAMVISLLVAGSTAVNIAFPGRAVLLVAFVLVVPGWVAVSYIRFRERLVEITASIALSISMGLLLAMLQLVTHFWHPRIAVILWAVATAAGALPHLLRPRPTAEPEPEPAKATEKAPEKAAAQPFLKRIPLSLVLAAVSLIVWFVGAQLTDSSQFGLLGMVDALSPLCWVALALLVGAMVIELRRSPVIAWRGYLLTAVLVIETYALQPLVENAARLPVAWLHVGFTDYIAQHGAVLESFDARFSWAGFFTLAAVLTKAAGMADAAPMLRWAPVVMMMGWMVPMGLIGRALRLPPRAIWLALWIFLAGDWVEQEYFSPQSLALLLFLCAVALAMRLLCRRLVQGNDGGVPRLDPGLDGHRPVARAATIGILVTVMAALAPTHQLTPYLLAGVMFLLAVLAGLRPRGLVVVAAVLPMTWLVLGAHDFWAGHLTLFTQDVGAVDSVVGNNLTERLAGSEARQLAQTVRLGLIAIIGLFAGIGALRWWRGGRLRTGFLIAVLAGSPASFVLVQSYGGEMFLRVWLFALPWVAMLAAGAFLPPAKATTVAVPGPAPQPRWLPVIATAVAVLTVTSIGLVARSANDGFTQVTAHQVAVMRQFFAQATPGTRLSQLNSYVVGGFEKMGQVTYTEVMPNCLDTKSVAQCVVETDPDVVAITKQQDIYGQLTQGLPAGWTNTVIDQLLATVRFTTEHRDSEITLLKSRVPTVLAIGDSVTLGDSNPVAGEDGTRSWPSMARDALDQVAPVKMINASADDESTAKMRKRLTALLATDRPDAVVIYGGPDDIYQARSTASSMADTLAMIKEVQAAGAKPVLVNSPPNGDPTVVPSYNAELTKLGAQTGVPVVDVYSLLAAPDGNWKQADQTIDSLHPSAAGAQVIAGAIADAIKIATGSSATTPAGSVHLETVK